jgi:hypothetical protein
LVGGAGTKAPISFGWYWLLMSNTRTPAFW